MNSVCEHCNKSFKSKWHLRRHLNRKVPCYEIRPPKSVSLRKSNVSLASVKCKSSVSLTSSFRGTESDTLDNQENHVCEYCNKSYNHRQSKYKHLQTCEKRIEKLENLNRVKYLIEMLENHQKIQGKNSQKMLKNVKNCKKNDKNCKKKIKNVKKSKNNNNSTNSNNLEVFKFNEEDLQLLNNFISNYNLQNGNSSNNLNSNNSINNSNNNNSTNNSNNTLNNNTTNNNTTNNNNNTTNNNTININIRAFGNENLDSLTKKDKISILNKSYNSFMESLEKVHFNIPENRNFFQPNKNKDYVEYYNGDNWIYENQDKFTDILSSKMINRLETWFEMYKKKLTSTKRHLIEQMIKEYSSGKIDKDLNEQTKKYLLSYSNNIKHFMDNEINNIGTLL